MYHYDFPVIRHIDDVLWAIEDSPEFIIANRDYYKIINYTVNFPDTFPPVFTAGGSGKERERVTLRKALRRECRGIVFNNDGKIIARRLHKFFNVNERDETLLHKIDFSKPHVILEKMDGSMITPIPYDENHWILGTKMGATDVANTVYDFLGDNPQYRKFIDTYTSIGITPIFEWCSRKNRIVIDYPVDRLVLIAMRNNVTGWYWPYPAMKNCADVNRIDVVRAYPGTVSSFQQLLDETRELKDQEGWVIRFDDGHMLKVKAEEYIQVHKAKDSINFEKNVIDIIMSDKVDDVKPFLLEQDRERLEEFAVKVLKGIDYTAKHLYNKFSFFRKELKGDRKRFALYAAPKLTSWERSIMFNHWDRASTEEDVKSSIRNIIKQNVSSKTKLETVRPLWNYYRWEFENIGDEDGI